MEEEYLRRKYFMKERIFFGKWMTNIYNKLSKKDTWGFRGHLDMLHLHTYANNGYLTKELGKVALMMSEKYKEYAKEVDDTYHAEYGNLFYRYVANLTNEGNSDEYNSIAEELLNKIKIWEKSSDRLGWGFQRAPGNEGVKEHSGHDLLFLTKFDEGKKSGDSSVAINQEFNWSDFTDSDRSEAKTVKKKGHLECRILSTNVL